MANEQLLKREDEILHSSIFGESGKSRGKLLERKIEVLENLAGKVSNRRSRRWLNDRLLIELVPRLNVEEIRGLFAPPPWGEETPLSAFSMTSAGDWDAFRSIDMEAQERIIKSLGKSSFKRKPHVDSEKAAALSAWHRVNCQTRDALKQSSFSDLVERFENCIRTFITESSEGDVLLLHIQDSFHRLLLHGVCQFYNLVSATTSAQKGAKLWHTTNVKKKSGCKEIPINVSLSEFLKMRKNGIL